MTTGWHDFDHLWDSLDLLRNRMSRLVTDLDRSWVQLPRDMADNYPAINLYDDDGHFRIEAEIPGFAKEDINIRIQGNYLELSGSRASQAPKGYSRHRQERPAATFSRSLTLPADIDQNRVEATLKNGILSLKLPKAESAKPRQIKIN
jgi:HSP20 family protein